MKPIWDLPSLPFLVRPLVTPHNPDGLPDSLPFHLGADPGTGRLLQLPTPELEVHLSSAYTHGSLITGVMDETGIGRQYAEDFLAILQKTLGSERFEGLRILEIGSGTGYLLHRLRLLGAEVRGVEPGPQAETGADRYDIRIDRGFFPGVDVGIGYDVVVLYLLLEHLAEPEDLLREVIRVLSPGGRVVIAVQDEEPYIRSGELSLLFHEHYSYFTARTLERTIRAAGGRRVEVRRSTFTNLLVATFRTTGDESEAEDVSPDVHLATSFRDRAERLVGTIWGQIDNVHRKHGTVGVYVPARAVNILAMREPRPDTLRFFDDNEALHGTYYPGFPMPIEDRVSLVSQPPSCVLIMSLSFGAAIAETIRERLPSRVQILELKDMLAG